MTAVGVRDIEWAAVASILATFPAGVGIAHQCGIDGAFIESEDLRILLIVAETCHSLGRDLTTALCVGKMALMRAGLWGIEWSDESLIAFARERRDDPVIGESAQIIRAIHSAWAEVMEADGPMFAPPPPLGKLDAIRAGLALRRLSELSGIPIGWIHDRFARICFDQDARIGAAVASPPKLIQSIFRKRRSA